MLDLFNYTPLQLVLGDSQGFAQRDGLLAAQQEVSGGMAWVHVRQSVDGTQLSTQRLVCNNELITRYGSEEAFETACQSYRGNLKHQYHDYRN